jgi:hypothetical protein
MFVSTRDHQILTMSLLIIYLDSILCLGKVRLNELSYDFVGGKLD